MAKKDKWTCQHFSMGNPAGKTATDLPRLLRRVAKEIERMEISAMDILDLTIASDMTADGPWWSVTVYFSKD
jgi:hypothetical protein